MSFFLVRVGEETENWCRVGDFFRTMSAGEEEFTLNYLQAQQDFSYEEIGDQLDDCDDTIARSIGENAISETIDISLLARNIRGCLKNRYLGLCSLNECVDKERVGTLLSNLQVSTHNS